MLIDPVPLKYYIVQLVEQGLVVKSAVIYG